MHIVMISREYLPTLRGGGIASYVKEVADGYVKSGHRVTVVCASDNTKNSSDVDIDGIRVIRLSGGDFIIPDIEGSSKLKKMRCLYRFHSYRKKIRNIILQLKDIDIIEVPEFGAESHYLHDLCIPIVLRLHTSAYTDRDTATKKRYGITQMHHYYIAYQEEVNAKRATYITSCSQSLKEWTAAYFHIIRDKIKVIYNPIQTEFWNKELAKIHLQNGNCRILYAGTVAEGKGINDLIEACQLLQQLNICVELIIAGKLGLYGKALKNKYIELKWCTFLGNIPREQLKQKYNECDVACFPSWWEAMGLVCTEAMACGCIVIGSASGGMSEIIENGKDGFLVPPRNPQKLAAIIKQAVNLSEAERDEMSRNAQNKIREKFGSNTIIRQMLNYYQQVIIDYKYLQKQKIQ